MDTETEYKHNLLTVMLLHWDTCTCSFMAEKELREAYSPSARPSCFVSGAYFYILYGRNPKFGVWMYHGMAKCRVLLSGHCDLELDL